MKRKEGGVDPQKEMAELELLAKGGVKKPQPVSRPSPLVTEQGLDAAQGITHPPGQADKSIEANLVGGVGVEKEQFPETREPESELKVALKKQFYELYLRALPYIETKQLKPEARKQLDDLEAELRQRGVTSEEIHLEIIRGAELEHSRHLLFNLYLRVPRGVTAYRDYPDSLKQEMNIILNELRRAGISDEELGKIRADAEQIRLAHDEKLAKDEKKEETRRVETLTDEDIDSLIASDPTLSGVCAEFVTAEEISISHAQDRKKGKIEQRVLAESIDKAESFLPRILEIVIQNKGYGYGKGNSEYVARRIAGRLRQRIRRKLGLISETSPQKSKIS